MLFFHDLVTLRATLATAVALSVLAGCSASTTQTVDAAGSDAAANDASALDGASDDAAMDDAATTPDAARDDAAASDAGPRPDAGMCVDLPAEPTRPMAIQCSACRLPGPGGVGGGGGCLTDADCTEGVNGRCSFGRDFAYCDYDECFADADCADDQVCLCDGSRGGTGGGNACISAECRVDADCEGGFACSPTLGSCGHYSNFAAYRCHRAADACTTDADCGEGYCAFDETADHWLCSTSECAG